MTLYQYPNYLMHYGVRGMKWGQRKNTQRSISRNKKWYGTTKNGEQIYLQRDRINPVARGIQHLTKQDFANYTARNSKGEKIGSIQLDRKNKNEMNTIWMDVKKNQQGKGYGQTIHNLGEQVARDFGATKMTAEVVGISPNMLHIAEKNHYVKVGQVKTKEMMDIWGGLTLVEKRFKAMITIFKKLTNSYLMRNIYVVKGGSMTLYRYPDYLMHYGVKGMRWGVVHEYEAVGRSTSKTKLTKEQKDEQLYATKISGQKKTKKQLKLEAKYKNKGMSSKEAEIKAYKTARNIRRAKIAGVAIVAAYAGYKVGSFAKDSGQLTALKNRNIDFNIDKSLASKNMSSDEIMNKIVSHINPGYGEKGTTMNCKRCTYAYEMSRRGYKVKATKSVKMTGQNLAGDYNVRHNTGGKNKLGVTTTSAFKDAFKASLKGENYVEKIQKNRIQVGVNEVNNVLSNKMPSGSRGEIIVKWKSGAQHSMAWEHIGDKAFIFDCQTNTKYSMDDFMKQLAPNITGTDLVRLDNVDFDMKYIKRWVQNA